MIQEIKAAKLDTVFLEWKVAAGDRVENGSVLCMVKLGTMKRTVTSKFDGVVTELLAQPGEAVPGGALICRIDAEEKPEGPVPVAPGTVIDVILERISGKSAIIKEWYKEPGDDVRPGEPIVSAEAGKLSTDISSSYGGTLLEILAEAGTFAAKGSIVARITADGTMIGPEAPRTKIAVIGGGPGGYVAAIRAAQLGAEVTLIEKGRIGGTCLNAGCIPTKALLHSAENYQTALNGAASGVLADNVRLDWKAVQAYRQGVSDRLIAGVEGLLTANGVAVIKGTARFAGSKKLTVQTDGGEMTLEPDRIIIATGSGPVTPPIPGLKENEDCIDSTGALMLESLPSSMIIIGGGVIGIELACAYAAMGTKITIVEMMDRLMPVMDLELTKVAQDLMSARGIEFYLETKVTAFRKSSAGTEVVTQLKDGTEKVFTADKVLVAVGRKSILDTLAVEAAGLVTERGHIVVNDKMETNVPDVYAIGDCVGRIMLAHTASVMGEVAAENAMGQDAVYDERVCPSCVYMLPEFACVGLNEEQLKAEGLKYRTGRFPLKANGKSLIMEETDGWIKILADKENGRILGVHILGPRATDLIAEAAIAMQMGATVSDLIHTIHAHPTVAEAMKEAALAVEKRAIHYK